MDYDQLEKAFETVRSNFSGAAPRIGVVLGSGWGEAASGCNIRAALSYSEIPGFGQPAVDGHIGELLWGEVSGIEMFFFRGRRHWYEGVGLTPLALPVYLLKRFEASALILSNAAGGINPQFKPGDLMLISDHINLMGFNPLCGAHKQIWGPRFPDMSAVYDPLLREKAFAVAQKLRENLREGVYCALSGPTFETPAEIKFLKTIGADAIGMSTVPEAILANAAGLRVLGISCIANLAAGISRTPLSHLEVFDTSAKALPRMRAMIEGLVPLIAA